jgi:hypothetical protein
VPRVLILKRHNHFRHIVTSLAPDQGVALAVKLITLNSLVMKTYIMVTHEELDAQYNLTGNTKDTLHLTPAIDRVDIDRWVFGWAQDWRYATSEEISLGNAEYFNPYVGEVNESAVYD